MENAMALSAVGSAADHLPCPDPDTVGGNKTTTNAKIKSEVNSERGCLSALNKTLTLKTSNVDFGFNTMNYKNSGGNIIKELEDRKNQEGS
jgi:hypothetical protein